MKPRPRAAALLAVLLLLPFLHEGTSAATLTRHPSLWLATPSSILIAWQTDVRTPGKVLYGTTRTLGSEAVDARSDTTDHAVTLTGLGPATRYWYRIVAGPDTLTPGGDTLHTAPAGTARFRFAAFGDCGSGDANQYAVEARIDALNPDLAIVLGDVIYDAGEAVNFTPRYFTPYRPILRRSVWYPVVGNHDITTLNGKPFLDAFYLPTNDRDGTEKYYSWDYSNVHFAAIDGNQPFNAAMYDWLDKDLAATTKRWKIVYFHQPIYSDPSTHGSDLNLRFYLEPIFNAHHVDLVFQGHNHYYSCSHPIVAGAAVDTLNGTRYRDPGGTIYVVAGGGGRGLYPVYGTDPLIRIARSVFHTACVDVAGDSIYVQAVLPNGTVIDSFSVTKSISTGVEVAAFSAAAEEGGIRLRWRAVGASPGEAFRLVRGAGEKLNSGNPIPGGPDYSFLDRNVRPGSTYSYGLVLVDASGQERTVATATGTAVPAPRFSVAAPRPNPFDRRVDVAYTLPRSSRVRVTILDVHGRRVRDIDLGVQIAGPHAIAWDGRDSRGARASAGIYFATLRAGADVVTARVVLLR